MAAKRLRSPAKGGNRQDESEEIWIDSTTFNADFLLGCITIEKLS